jgi:hypothetical protein
LILIHPSSKIALDLKLKAIVTELRLSDDPYGTAPEIHGSSTLEVCFIHISNESVQKFAKGSPETPYVYLKSNLREYLKLLYW